jgi:hypothetical protein
MDDMPNSEQHEQVEQADPPCENAMGTESSEANRYALAGGPRLSLALSFVALIALGANHQITQFWRAQTEPTLSATVTAVISMTLAMLVAVPSLVTSVVFALASLVTVQRRWGLSVLALLVSAATVTVFLLME